MTRQIIGLLVLLGALVGCGDDVGVPASSEDPSGTARPEVFEPGQLVWAQRSTIHVGDQTYDVGPSIVEGMDWTPYGLYLQLTEKPDDGPYRDVFFDGTTMTTVSDVYTNLITSRSGRTAAWIDSTGPERPAGQVAQVVVVDTRTGKRIFESADGMGGEKGDDIGARYENLPPGVVDLTDDRLVWINSEDSGNYVTTDLETGTSTKSKSDPISKPVNGYEYWSPDGRYQVDATTTGKLTVTPRQPPFGHRFQTPGGWLDDHTMLTVAQDRYQFSYDPNVPDKTRGHLLACDLDADTCQELSQVKGARDVVFPGVDVEY